MSSKFSPIIAMVLLAGAEIAAPNNAESKEAHAATLDQAATPTRVRCFMGTSGDMRAAINGEFVRGWQCVPEQAPASTH